MELAKKLKEARKTKRLTIAEILGNTRQLQIRKPVLGGNEQIEEPIEPNPQEEVACPI